MNIIIITLLSIIGIIALIGLWYAGVYNSLVHVKSNLDEALSGVDVQLKRRYDLIPNLVAVVKQYGVHEKEIFENLAKMRAASMGASTVQEKSQADMGLTQTLKTLFAVSESYPELKANQNFLQLQHDLSSIESDLQLSRRYYNGTVRNYNIKVLSFPSNLVANFSNFTKAAYFEVNSQAEREAPKVSF